MKRLIKSSLFLNQVQQIILLESMKIQEKVKAEDIIRRDVTFEVYVSFSQDRNPICSVILNKGD